MAKAKALKLEDIRAKSDDELSAVLGDHAKELFNLRFQKANGTLENAARSRIVRREVARVKTVMTERRNGVTIKARAAAKAAKPKAAPKAKAAKKKAGE
jgi:large subunit ribosomal protein L29